MDITTLALCKKEIQKQIANKDMNLHFQKVNSLPNTGETNFIYLVPQGGLSQNLYKEYIWIDNHFELLGTNEINLNDYATKQEVATKLEKNQGKINKGKSLIVDDNGNLIPEFNSGAVIQSIEPENKNTIWLDTSDNTPIENDAQMMTYVENASQSALDAKKALAETKALIDGSTLDQFGRIVKLESFSGWEDTVNIYECICKNRLIKIEGEVSRQYSDGESEILTINRQFFRELTKFKAYHPQDESYYINGIIINMGLLKPFDTPATNISATCKCLYLPNQGAMLNLLIRLDGGVYYAFVNESQGIHPIDESVEFFDKVFNIGSCMYTFSYTKWNNNIKTKNDEWLETIIGTPLKMRDFFKGWIIHDGTYQLWSINGKLYNVQVHNMDNVWYIDSSSPMSGERGILNLTSAELETTDPDKEEEICNKVLKAYKENSLFTIDDISAKSTYVEDNLILSSINPNSTMFYRLDFQYKDIYKYLKVGNILDIVADLEDIVNLSLFSLTVNVLFVLTYPDLKSHTCTDRIIIEDVSIPISNSNGMGMIFSLNVTSNFKWVADFAKKKFYYAPISPFFLDKSLLADGSAITLDSDTKMRELMYNAVLARNLVYLEDTTTKKKIALTITESSTDNVPGVSLGYAEFKGYYEDDLGKHDVYIKFDNNTDEFIYDVHLAPQKQSGVGKQGAGQFSEVFNNLTNNNASGKYSHAEGCSTTASGDIATHAEGYFTKALGDKGSHAEGWLSQATGQTSHAEGFSTLAKGAASHAEGLYTIASGGTQHVEGQMNIEDVANKYAHIIGNGTQDASNHSEIIRSNAHTLDWKGNAWYQGKIKVGGTGYEDPSAVEILDKTTADSLYVTQTEYSNSPKIKVLTQQQYDQIVTKEPTILYVITE